jgi:hypothetical protein
MKNYFRGSSMEERLGNTAIHGRNYWGIISVDFDVVDQLLIKYSAFVRYWRIKWEYSGTVHQAFIEESL